MAYNSIEKKRLEEYKRNLSLIGTNKSSIDLSKDNIPGGINYLPTASGKMARQVKTSQKNNNKLGATLGNAGLLLGKGAVKSSEGILDFLNDMTAKYRRCFQALFGRAELLPAFRRPASEDPAYRLRHICLPQADDTEAAVSSSTS